MSLGSAAGTESCCCQRKRLDDSANEVLYWVWQQTTGGYFMEERGYNSCLYSLPSQGHSYLDWWTGQYFISHKPDEVCWWLDVASYDWSKVLTSPIMLSAPWGHLEFGASRIRPVPLVLRQFGRSLQRIPAAPFNEIGSLNGCRNSGYRACFITRACLCLWIYYNTASAHFLRDARWTGMHMKEAPAHLFLQTLT